MQSLPLVGFAVLVAVAPTAAAQSAQSTCVGLQVDGTTPVGRVCVEHQGDTLRVTFTTAGGWALTETHLAVAASLEGIPRAGGRQPILGQFPYKADHVPIVTDFSYAVPLTGRAGGPASTLVIAAHASVVRNGTEEGAWAEGSRFAAEGNPATYFTYALGAPR